MQRIVFTVTNNLVYDQRMIRICTSLVKAGYAVKLIGVKKVRAFAPLQKQPYQQKRLDCFFEKGFLFYAEFNIRLFIYLLFTKGNVFCCVDIDTMLPVFLAAKLKRKKIVYDAHEYFSQQKEVISRPKVYKVWHWIEKTFIPKFKNGYTVSNSIATKFKKLYKVDYEIITNATVLNELVEADNENHNKILLYQGAVNHARGFEYLIPAMQQVNATLHIYGDGNYFNDVRELIVKHNLQHKVFLKGKALPKDLEQVTSKAAIGINLIENNGLNQYYSLANKFFDYIHAEIPQVTMNFPSYKSINDKYQVAILIDDLHTTTITNALNNLLQDEKLYALLKLNCKQAKQEFNWQNEEIKLINFYKKLFTDL